jgi:ankyrin repeat protein
MAVYSTIIGGELQRLKRMEDNKCSEDVMDFLEQAHSALQFNGVSNLKGPCKRSLMHYAAMGDCRELLLQLLALRTPIELRDGHHRTPLSWAAQYGSCITARILVENGANVNALDKTFMTPLSRLLHEGKNGTKNYAALKVYLEKNGATTKGRKRAWIRERLRLQHYSIPNIATLAQMETNKIFLAQTGHLRSEPWRCRPR